MSILEQIKGHWRHAFTIPRAAEWNDDDQALIEKLAAFVVRRGLSAPATMLLESRVARLILSVVKYLPLSDHLPRLYFHAMNMTVLCVYWSGVNVLT